MHKENNMKLGLHRGTVAVEPHNSEWEVTAQQTISKLREILGNTAVDIQHIGSTSVRNICAKPIIDIAVGVRDFRDILGLNAVLEDNGFIFRGQDVPDQYLYVCGDKDSRTHHIHTVIYGSKTWNNYINMRDYLNCHKAEAQAYSKLKEKLARLYPDDRNRYTELKSGLIAEILKKANNWRYK